MMTETKTEPVAARHLTKDEFRAQNLPGSFFVEEPDSDGELAFWYRCPCGCGTQAPLNVGKGFKPVSQPSWNWNGLTAFVTLEPSVHHQGHWHGWLKRGVWVSC